MLLFHGARLDIPTNYGHSSELTTDIGKLEIIYNFITYTRTFLEKMNV